MTEKIAIWKGLRVQSNGLVFLEDTQKLATETIVKGVRYIRCSVDGKKRAVSVGKLVYALFSGDRKCINTIFSKSWNVTYKNGNKLDCDIENLYFRVYATDKMTFQQQREVFETYDKGVKGYGYYAIAKKFDITPSKVQRIVKKFKEREGWK